MATATGLQASFAHFCATAQPRIILGSQSSSRKQIMNELLTPHNVKYIVRTADIDEKAIRAPDAEQLVTVLAQAKAQAILAKMKAAGEDVKTGFLLTCDQVVVHNGAILEKPESPEEARSFIQGYSSHPPSTVGSVLCSNLSSGESFGGTDISTIHFSAIPDATVDELLRQGDCMYCAGGLMVEHPLVIPHVTKMEGTEDSVMGLSKVLTMQLLLRAAGFEGFV